MRSFRIITLVIILCTISVNAGAETEKNIYSAEVAFKLNGAFVKKGGDFNLTNVLWLGLNEDRSHAYGYLVRSTPAMDSGSAPSATVSGFQISTWYLKDVKITKGIRLKCSLLSVDGRMIINVSGRFKKDATVVLMKFKDENNKKISMTFNKRKSVQLYGGKITGTIQRSPSKPKVEHTREFSSMVSMWENEGNTNLLAKQLLADAKKQILEMGPSSMELVEKLKGYVADDKKGNSSGFFIPIGDFNNPKGMETETTFFDSGTTITSLADRLGRITKKPKKKQPPIRWIKNSLLQIVLPKWAKGTAQYHSDVWADIDHFDPSFVDVRELSVDQEGNITITVDPGKLDVGDEFHLVVIDAALTHSGNFDFTIPNKGL